MIEYKANTLLIDPINDILRVSCDTQGELENIFEHMKTANIRISELHIRANTDKLTIGDWSTIVADIILIHKSNINELNFTGHNYKLRMEKCVIHTMNVTACVNCYIENSVVLNFTGNDKCRVNTENTLINAKDTYHLTVDISNKHFIGEIMSLPGSTAIVTTDDLYHMSYNNCGIQVYTPLNICVNTHDCDIVGVHTRGAVEVTGKCKSFTVYGTSIKCLPNIPCTFAAYSSFRECNYVEINEHVQIAPHAIRDFTLSSAKIIGFDSKNITHCNSMIEYIELYVHPDYLEREDTQITSFVKEMLDNPVTHDVIMSSMSYTMLRCCRLIYPDNEDMYIESHINSGSVGSAGARSNKFFTEMVLNSTKANKMLFIEKYNVPSAYFTGNKLAPHDNICYKAIYESVYPESHYEKFNMLHLDNNVDISNITPTTTFYGGRFNLAISSILKNTKFMNKALDNKSFTSLCFNGLTGVPKIEFMELLIIHESKMGRTIDNLMRLLEKYIVDEKAVYVPKFSAKFIKLPEFIDLHETVLTDSFGSWIGSQPVLFALLKKRNEFMTELINEHKRNISFETLKLVLNFCMDNPNDYNPKILKSIFDAVGTSNFPEIINPLVVLLSNRKDINQVVNLFSTKEKKTLYIQAMRCATQESVRLAELINTSSSFMNMPPLFNSKPLQKLSLKYSDTITYNQLQLFKKTYNKGTTEYNQFNSVLSLMKPNESVKISSLLSIDSIPEETFPFININDFKFEMEPITLSSQSMSTDQYVFRIVIPKNMEFARAVELSLKNFMDSSTTHLSINNKLISSIESNHPVSAMHPTLGWVRFSVDQNKKNIWISEIQTDMTKHIRIMNKNMSNNLYDVISSMLFYTFKLALKDSYPGFNLVVLSAPTRQSLLGGNPSPSVYDNNARAFGLKKHQVTGLHAFNRIVTGCIWTENIDVV